MTSIIWDEWLHVLRRDFVSYTLHIDRYEWSGAESTHFLARSHDIFKLTDFNQNTSASDPRVGSSRNGSDSTSVAKNLTQPTNSASLSVFFVSLVPVFVYAVICTIVFIVGRKYLPRVYTPRTFLSSLEPHERTKPLPNGWFNWCKQFWNTPDIEVLHRSSFDGFLFLRYLKVILVICCFGFLITWPILLPVAATGGAGNKQLDELTFGNISEAKRLYAHALVAWVFFGFVIFMVGRECVFFINIRQAYLLSPFYANRLSSRTVLFTCVPANILSEKKLRRVLGDTVKNVWIPKETEELDELVEEREQTALRLEKAEIELIKKANVAYEKARKNGHPDIEKATPLSTVSDRDSQEFKQSAESQRPKGMGMHISTETSDSPLPPIRRVSSFRLSQEYLRTDGISKQSGEMQRPKGMNMYIKSETSDSPLSPISPGSSVRSPQEYSRADGTPMTAASYGFDGPSPDIVGSMAALWIPAEERPHHRPIANYGRRVDTIRWTRSRLKALSVKISKLRRDYRKGKGHLIPAAFIEFHTQVDAQAAYQTLAHHIANNMRSEIVGVRPDEIYWKAISFSWYERIIRRFLMQCFVASMVIFWSIPAALCGIITNISYLTEKFSFLAWIDKLPTVVLNLIEGLLPAVALSFLMSLVPGIMRMVARQAGVPTASRIELFVQGSYYVFQLVQVFLITTLTSAASAALTQILKDPLSARDLLSKNLPTASNFYISYFMLQGLAMSATRIAHGISIIRHGIYKNSGTSPRQIAAKYHRLRKIHWGSVYPVFTNMGIIAITYSIIAPIVLGVGAIAFSLIYLSYRWNLLYVYSSDLDTRGLCYPRALKQTLTGVYLAEICLIGLFGLKGAYGPLIMMFGLVIFTAMFHISLNDALSPLLYNLPRTLAAEEELLKVGNNVQAAENLEDYHDHDIETVDHDAGYGSDFDPGDPAAESHGAQSSRGPEIPIEGGSRALNLGAGTIKSAIRKKYTSSPIPDLITRIDFWSPILNPIPDPSSDKKPNFILKFLHPTIFCDYHILRSSIPQELYHLEQVHNYPEKCLKDAFSPPSVRKRAPRIWIPNDKSGANCSSQEVAHCGKVVECTDVGAWVDEKGRVSVDVEADVGQWVLEDWRGVRF